MNSKLAREILTGMIRNADQFAYAEAYDRVAEVMRTLGPRERVYVCAVLGAHVRRWAMDYGISEAEANEMILAGVDQAARYV
jgi:predicted urease superfamily metal-dependent hydrolase